MVILQEAESPNIYGRSPAGPIGSDAKPRQGVTVTVGFSSPANGCQMYDPHIFSQSLEDRRSKANLRQLPAMENLLENRQ